MTGRMLPALPVPSHRARRLVERLVDVVSMAAQLVLDVVLALLMVGAR